MKEFGDELPDIGIGDRKSDHDFILDEYYRINCPFNSKNGVYLNLMKDVRHAFEESELVKIDCTGMHASDYKKLGAKLKPQMKNQIVCGKKEKGRDQNHPYKVIELTPQPKNLGIRYFPICESILIYLRLIMFKL
ncbi:hypothetical protein M8C21_020387, partial [Ambrosia artemisiifolia]